jgi:16S rRNA (uracil1498-N3)-methyltransferase
MPRFPISEDEIKDNHVNISGADYRHIVKVLRLKEGSDLILFDASGAEHLGIITEINSKQIKVAITATQHLDTESKLHITLLQGIAKGDKMDFIVEKATELGVKRIIPVISERSQVRNTQKTTRWRRIAVEACKQCRRFAPPQIDEALSFDQAINVQYNGLLKIILYEKDQEKLTDKINNYSLSTNNILIFIGPEGGFSDNELRLARDKGFISMGLGPRILRTETAGIVAISILQFLYGDI